MSTQPDCKGNIISNLRDGRYGEAIPVTVVGDTQTSWIYNTICLNNCPEDQWNQLTDEEIKIDYLAKDPNTVAGVKNGPRYWIMDQLEGLGSSIPGLKYYFGGIEMELRGQIVTPVGQIIGDQPWVIRTVNRETIYTYEAGKPVFELITPQNQVFIMQSYSQQKEPITYNELPLLERKGLLQLPENWTYRTRVPKEDLVLVSPGQTNIVSDNLANTYQILPQT